MADQRITQLTQLSEADVAATDVLPIVDISASETKKVTAKDLFEAGATLADSSSIDLAKLNQSSATKLGTTALADDLITAAKLANDSSIAVQTTAPASDNFEGRGHFNGSTGYLNIYNGSSYQQVVAPTAGIENLAVTTGKLANNAVTTAKVDATGLGTAAIANLAVTGAKIADGTITSGKFQAGAVDSAAIATDAVGAAELANDAVDTTAIVNSAVTEAKIATGAVTETKLGTGAVTNDKIANTTIAYGKLNLADGSVPGAKITSDSITATQLATGSVDTAAIIDDAVTTAKIADDAITADQLATGSVTADAVAVDAVGTIEIVDDAVTYAKIQNVTATDKLLGRSSAGAGNIEEIDCTSAGRALLDDADAAAQRTTLGLGTMATQAASAVAITGGTATLSSVNTSSATITGGAITGITDIAVADGGTGASDAGTARTNLGVEIGTNVQAYDAGLQSIAGLTTSADQTVYTTGSDTYATTSLTSFGRSLIDDADASTARTTLGLGTLATQSGTFSGTHSGTTSGTNTGDQTIALTGDVTGSGTGSFAATIANDAVTTAKILDANVTTAKLAAAAVTGVKLAADSSTVVSGNAPSGNGEFEGQQWVNTNTGLAYVWTGAAWQQVAALQTITFSDSTPIAFSVTKPDNFSATITTTLDNQNAGTVFAGPATGSATAPTFRVLTATDLPIATSGANGAIQPGTGLSVTGAGVLNHTNTVSTGTYTKVTVDAQGHVTTGATLAAADIPNLDASKITTGTFSSAFLANNSVTAQQLADYGIAQVSETAPTPEFAGQWWINPSDRSAYIWVGTVSPSPNGYWLLVGYGSPTQLNLRFGGTYNASTNLIVTLNQYGTEAGLTVGQALGTPNSQNNGVYLIVTTAGTGTTPAPTVSLAAGDWVLSQGTGANWTKIAVVSGATGTFNDYDILSDGTYFTPDMIGVTDVREALVLLWGRAQIATTSQIGVVLESTEVLVDNSTGEMTIGVVDDGTY